MPFAQRHVHKTSVVIEEPLSLSLSLSVCLCLSLSLSVSLSLSRSLARSLSLSLSLSLSHTHTGEGRAGHAVEGHVRGCVLAAGRGAEGQGGKVGRA